LAAAALEDGEAAIALNHGLAAVEAARDTQFTGYWSARDAYFLLGAAQSQMGLHHEAIGSFATALEAQPGDAQLLYRLGVAELLVGNFEVAESNLRLALQARQPFPEAEADLGVVLAEQGRFVESYPLLADAIGRGLGNARRHRAMALTMLDARQYRDAVEQLEQSLALEENAAERARLAWALWQLGESDQAHRHLNMALLMEEDQTSEYVEWVRQEIQAPPDDTQIAEPEDDAN
jgi:tetratricopeptide (TPR) repeat protein